MSHLILRKNGKDILQVSLTEGNEYIGGREETCQIYLNAAQVPGISRRHFRVFFENDQWRIETLSRHGNVYYRGQTIQLLVLSHEDVISIGPFELHFVEEKNHSIKAKSSAIDREDPFANKVDDFEDKTNVMPMRTLGSLKANLADGTDLGTFILEGNSWICGRETSCQIFIDHSKMSRRHFEIRSAGSDFVIRDLGSVNGTMLNHQLISSESWHPLRSGDVIQVADVTIVFEVRDTLFDQKNQNILEVQNEIKEVIEVEEVENPMMNLPPTLDQASYAGNKRSAERGVRQWWSDRDEKQKKFYTVIAIVLVVLILLMLPDDRQKKSNNQAESSSGSNTSAASSWTTEQKKEFDSILDRAKSEIATNKFDVALQSLHSLHEKTKQVSYEGSKELELITIEKRKSYLVQQDLEQKEKEKSENQNKIKAQVNLCRTKVHSKTEMKDVEECLMPVITLDPSNADIENLKKEVEQKITDRQLKEVQRKDHQQKIQHLRSMYQNALNLLAQSKPKMALEAFQAVAKSTLPDPDDLKGKSSGQIQQIRNQQSSQMASWLKEIDKAKSSGDMKGAYSLLMRAIQQEPENDELRVKQQQILNELKRKMQSVFQEAILEENIGEVDSARAKWKKILESSVPDEDYYKKAKQKLKKYEPVY
jgi:pSer/pThr/pTyr-binding forkhead associated (FHA) protein